MSEVILSRNLFGWEFVMYITGIRGSSLKPLIANSLIETNMGLPYIYFIHKYISNRRREDLTKIE